MTKSASNHNLYFCRNEGLCVVIMSYVDDLLLTRDDTTKLQFLENNLEGCFEMSRVGLFFLYIGVQFIYLPQGVLLLQRNYAYKLLEKYKMQDCVPIKTPRKKVLSYNSTWEQKKHIVLIIKAWQMGGCKVRWTNSSE